MKTKVIYFFLFCLTTLFSQTPIRRLQSDMTGGAGFSFELWKAKKDKVTELSIPITFIYPYTPKLGFYAITSPALSNFSAGESYNLSGLSDIKWGGHYLAFDNRYLFTFGMNLPTGKSTLKTEEYAVASALVIPAFNFRVPTFGQGLDIQLGVSSAKEFGGFVVGFGASYLMKGAFKPFIGVDQSYNPGEEITLAAGIDKEAVLFAKEMRLTGDVLYSIYSADVWGGEKVFQSGNRLLIQLLSAFKMEPVDISIFIRERIKDRNKIGSGDVFETELKNSNTNQFEIQSFGFYPYTKSVRLKGVVEFKLYSNNDYDRGGATLFGLGGGGQIRLSPQMLFNGDLRLYFGNIKTGSERIGTFGLKIYGGVDYTF